MLNVKNEGDASARVPNTEEPVMKYEACVLACTKTWNSRMPERRNTKTGNPEHKITKTRNAF